MKKAIKLRELSKVLMVFSKLRHRFEGKKLLFKLKTRFT